MDIDFVFSECKCGKCCFHQISQNKDSNKFYGIFDPKTTNQICDKRNECILALENYSLGVCEYFTPKDADNFKLPIRNTESQVSDTVIFKKDGENIQRNKIGNEINNIFSKKYLMLGKEKILNFKLSLEENSHFQLCYFSDYSECLNQLQGLVQHYDIISHSPSESCNNFLKYYEDYTNKKDYKLEDFIMAGNMVNDYCNMLICISGSFNFIKRDKVTHEGLGKYTGKISKALCFEVSSEIKRFEIVACDEEDKTIEFNRNDAIFHNEKILIPFEILRKKDVNTLEILFNDSFSIKLKVVNYLKPNENFIKTQN